MKSRKILVAVVVGMLMISLLGPVVASCKSDCETTGFEECTIRDWIEWLFQLFIWIQGIPDGPPPVPSCYTP